MKHRNPIRFAAILGAAVLSLLSATVMSAQTASTGKDDGGDVEDAVIVGYGSTDKESLSSAISIVSGEEISERASALDVLQGIAGKAAGVNVISGSGRPGGYNIIRVRGVGSLNSSSDPLYIIDGIVSADPSLLNNDDIESVEILKDAAATSIYGSKGANGVVIITTKSGKKGSSTLTFNTNTGVALLSRTPQLLDAQQYLNMYENACAYSGEAPYYLINPNEAYFDYKKDSAGNYAKDANGYLIPTNKYDTDWYKEIARTAIVTNNTLSFSQGKDNTQIYAGLGYQNQQGVVLGTDASRVTGNLNIKSQIKKWFDVQVVASGMYSVTNNPGMEGSSYGALGTAFSAAPIFPADAATIYDCPDGGDSYLSPVGMLGAMTDQTIRNAFKLGLTNTFHLAKGLDLVVKGDYQKDNTTCNVTADSSVDIMDEEAPYAKVYNYYTVRWSNEDYLSYKTEFFDGALASDFVLGASYYSYRNESSFGGTHNLSSDFYSYHNLGVGTAYNPESALVTEKTASTYFLMNHNLKGKYLLGFSLRYDGVSYFGNDWKYELYPSVSF